MTLRDRLIACGAVRFGDFTLTSGEKSRYYVDIKKASADPEILGEIGRLIAPRVEGHARIAGMELGAVPIAVSAALASGAPYLMVRKGERAHGTGKRIEGDYAEGERVLVVEDVTTSGGSSIEAINVLREAGLVVDRVVTVVDREQGAADAFRDVGVTLDPLVTASDLLKEVEEK